MSFGGPAFPINPVDLNFGQLGGGRCMGAIFSMGTPGRGQAAWIIGDVFLVRDAASLPEWNSHCSRVRSDGGAQKNVYTVFRNDPPHLIDVDFPACQQGVPDWW
jgi:hypothetical protein